MAHYLFEDLDKLMAGLPKLSGPHTTPSLHDLYRDPVEKQLEGLRNKYWGQKYVPLADFLQMIDLECKLRKRKPKR